VQNIYVEGHLVQKLLNGHTDAHTLDRRLLDLDHFSG